MPCHFCAGSMGAAAARYYVEFIIARIVIYVKLPAARFAVALRRSPQNQSRRQKIAATESDSASEMARIIQNAAGHSWKGNATFIP